MLAVCVVLAGLQPAIPTALNDYVMRDDAATRWSVVSPTEIELTSQSWMGRPWKHALIQVPYTPQKPRGAAILYVTGNGPDPREINRAVRMARQADLPVWMLYNVPNQPLFGLNEDALIAHTFQKYMETGDEAWPLVFPMAKAARSAMDAIQDASKSAPIRRFVVTGMSKRGWTAWMAGATGDSRIAGLAPMVYDNLNIPAQLPHQLASWGKYSEMIGDYTDRGLPEVLKSEQGMRLARMVDPFSYLPRITAPTLVVNGANDRFWTVDAHGLYWGAMKMPKSLCIVPNEGHNLGDREIAYDAVGAFARSSVDGWRYPRLDITPRKTTNGWWVDVRSIGRNALRIRLWSASSNSRDFRNARWTEVPSPEPRLRQTVEVGFRFRAPGRFHAVMGIADYRAAGVDFKAMTPIKVLEN